jgi:hypothetical protein
MGRIAHVESFAREDDGPTVKADPGGGALVTADHCEPAGDDSQPLPGDYATLVPCAGTGREAAVAYCDPIPGNKVAGAGERRIYSRDSAGTPVAEVYCRADGSILIRAINGAPIEVRSTGTITANSPDVRLGGGGKPVAIISGMIAGTMHGLAGAPGSPLVPNPAPVPGAGVPFVAKIISGVSGVKASNGTGT